MARGVAHSPERVLEVLDVATHSAERIAEVVGLPRQTVESLLARYSPVSDALRTVKTEWLRSMWQSVAVGALAKLHEAAHQPSDMKPQDAKSWAIVAGIATEKTLLLDGRPTQIGFVVHEHREEIAALAGKLMRMVREGTAQERNRDAGERFVQQPQPALPVLAQEQEGA